MQIALRLVRPFEVFNDMAGKVGRSIAIVALGLMVVVILMQVFFRYVLNNALPWPDEAARFLMLWLTGLMAPVAMRSGGMVAITSLQDLLPPALCRILLMSLLLVSMLVLVTAIGLGWQHVNSGWLFASSSLKLPLHWIGLEAVKIKLAWMYMSLFVGFCLMFSVNVELLLRMVVDFLGGGAELKPLESRQRTD